MSNDDLTYGYTSSLANLTARLRATADRIDRDCRTVVGPHGNPAHSTAAAAAVHEVMAMMGNLPMFNLVQNAAYADAQWDKTPTVDVKLIEVNPERFTRTVVIVRDNLTDPPGEEMDEASRVTRAVELTNSVYLNPGQAVAEFAVGVSREKAEKIVAALAAQGSAGVIVG